MTLKTLATVLGALLIVTPGWADERAQEALIERLEATETLQANFEQTTYAEGQMRGERSTGRMIVSRPLKFAWLVDEPFEQQVISDGQTLWVYEPDLMQATYQPVTDQIQQSPAMILAQPRQALGQRYDVVEASDKELTAYRLYPHDTNAMFTDMTLLFESGVISEIRLTDNLGQDTRISLTEVRVGETLDPGLFDFEPPPGTDVFEQM
ncbi:MAG: outer membrane lipoprotein chaperone LolA [Saccharospirillum sp.]|nr:outer membrane lipoprotein chaperone LolA [Saccharospirillum sp.]